MSDIAIHVEGLGKKYRIGQLQKYKAVRDVLAGALKAPVSAATSMFRSSNGRDQDAEIFWALKDVSFDVPSGEALGIIGPNGAGKSTLLKILSRITEPTEGYARVRGRVGSLLEVGTGFHPELTGRENVFLNGAILGMRKTEIERKFDEIVAFAEMGKFIDTAVKLYSSGMYVRLAFAVAAHLEPEILLVDEVLAVGDAAFQRKCLGKMGDVARAGRTVLFVSHNMAAVERLCERAILITDGQVARSGATDMVIEHYLRSQGPSHQSRTDLTKHSGRRVGSEIILREVRVLSGGEERTNIRMGDPLTIVTRFQHVSSIHQMRFGIAIEDHTGQRILNFSPSHQDPELIHNALQKGTIDCAIESLPLVPGTYYITIILAHSFGDLDRIDRAVELVVEPSDVFGTGKAPSRQHGIFYLDAHWKLQTK